MHTAGQGGGDIADHPLRQRNDRRKKMLYADVSRAYFYARAARPVYVKLPEEDREPGDQNTCGK